MPIAPFRHALPPELSLPVLARSLADTGRPLVWLDSGPDAREGVSVLALADSVLRTGDGVGPEEFLDRLRAALRPGDEEPAPAGPFGEALPRFRLGWALHLDYEFGLSLLGLPAAAPRALALRVTAAVELDHASGTLTLLAESEAIRDSWLATHASALRTAPPVAPAAPSEPSAPSPPPGTVTAWRHTDDAYRDRILACQERIRAGDAYVLCLTNEAVRPAPRGPASDPLALYLRLREVSPAHHGGLIWVPPEPGPAGTGNAGTGHAAEALLSASPERFLAVTGDGRVSTVPIKGTRPRSADPARDAALAAELAANEKERAENLMIVDLMRNDLSRVCAPGSVRVGRFLAVEPYRHVFQLTSTVTGALAPGLDALDALRSCFPAGSMTGAPKRSAAQILAGLEQGDRGGYSGCFGYLSHGGDADLAMVIRSIVLRDGLARVGAGGGITADSVPEEEMAEVHLKAAALLRVLGAEIGESAPEKRAILEAWVQTQPENAERCE
ncbi:anthranilate synthase component I family protein [Leucobacter sp. M11]|uniref:anthranilate synthase component I family protein n=1 Tax=Leucobacter sp. M11 TaxID=2993565 RepID=UPI002D8111D6|nr:anthranilate synthase component I family protein [Leucobacter sp. M11]MEB4616680.1 anthranilate synthase component I family protein [Leucobacter sp. M11]